MLKHQVPKDHICFTSFCHWYLRLVTENNLDVSIEDLIKLALGMAMLSKITLRLWQMLLTSLKVVTLPNIRGQGDCS